MTVMACGAWWSPISSSSILKILSPGFYRLVSPQTPEIAVVLRAWLVAPLLRADDFTSERRAVPVRRRAVGYKLR